MTSGQRIALAAIKGASTWQAKKLAFRLAAELWADDALYADERAGGLSGPSSGEGRERNAVPEGAVYRDLNGRSTLRGSRMR